MRYHLILATFLSAWLAGGATAQGHAALCRTAKERLVEAEQISREMMQAPLAGLDTAYRLATELPEEHQAGAMAVMEIIIEASLAGLESRNDRFTENQIALADILHDLCVGVWSAGSPILRLPPILMDETRSR